MDIPDILKIVIFEDFLKIVIFEDFLKIAKKGPPKDPIGALLGFHENALNYCNAQAIGNDA